MTTNTSQSKSDIVEKLKSYVAEAADLRYSVTTPKIGSDQSQLLAALQDHRAKLDRIEYLMVESIILRGSAFRQNKDAQDDLQDKWDDALVRSNTKKAASLVSANEFVAPKEKYASANLSVLEIRRSARKLEEILLWAETTVDAITKMYRGLDSARQDLLTRIKAVPMVNSMEYTTS